MAFASHGNRNGAASRSMRRRQGILARPAQKEHQSGRNVSIGTITTDLWERGQMADDNPKRDANIEKDPDDWISGGDPMTAAQASYLKTLSEEAHRPDAYAPNLTKAEASKRIDALRQLIKTRDR
jgi:Protein of unknown function (DUF3072)